MWIYQLIVWNRAEQAAVAEQGTRDQVMAAMCSSRYARALSANGAVGWALREVFVSQVK